MTLNWYTNKKVVVTGGAGFIGSHLSETLIAQGAQVTILDNFSTGKKENIDPFLPQITCITGDIRDPQTCLEATKGAYAVFHLAALVSVPQSIEDPALCHDINVVGTSNMLKACVANNVQRFIFSSSCAVYGDHQGPCTETSPCNPTSPYAQSKYEGELLCRSYTQLFKLPTLCLRYFNVFGPRQDPHGHYAGVIAKFTGEMLAHQPITVFGDGLQSRDFVPVQDIVQANSILAQLPDQLLIGQPVNIATGTSITLLELIDKLKKTYTTYDQPTLFAPARLGEIKHSQGSNATYQQLRKLVL